MKKLNKKIISTENNFDLIDSELSLFIQGGADNLQSNSQKEKEHEFFWQKATFMLDDLR